MFRTGITQDPPGQMWKAPYRLVLMCSRDHDGMSVQPWRVALGRRVHDARMDRGWSWGAVDRLTEIAPTTWRRVEEGRETGDHALLGIADALGWDKGECFRIMADALDGKGD